MTATIVTTVSVLFDGSTVTDISSRVEGLTINYGRARVIDEFGAGFASITVDDRDNFITPGHSDSTMGNTQLIGRQVRISTRVTGGSDSYDTYLFRGFIQDVDYLPIINQRRRSLSVSMVSNFSLGQSSNLRTSPNNFQAFE